LVELPPVPAMTFTLPAANLDRERLMTADVFLVIERGDSPVVPTGTMPSTPPLTWALTSLFERGLVEFATLGERGDDGGVGSGKLHSCFCKQGA
jgi:hypothetical protein